MGDHIGFGVDHWTVDERLAGRMTINTQRRIIALEGLAQEAERLYSWVGPGDPDLDDPAERARFMRDVCKVAWAWASLEERSSGPGGSAFRRDHSNDGGTK